jgi:uncharacterized damage-inducible protein DinB
MEHMSETTRIADELRLAFDGEAWHGPALLEILVDVNAASAAEHPIANGHSIWELVLHIAAWEKILLRRMSGEAFQPRDEENFPPVLDHSEGAWAEAQAHLKRAHEDLMQAIRRVPEAKLNQVVPGKNYDFYFMLHGGSQHIAYHGGQISLLKKMAKS